MIVVGDSLDPAFSNICVSASFRGGIDFCPLMILSLVY